MASILRKIEHRMSDAFEKRGHSRRYGVLFRSQRPDLGQFQCNGALEAASAAKVNARDLANVIVTELSRDPIFDQVKVAGPGFINIRVSDTYLIEFLVEMASHDRFGFDRTVAPRNVVIDFGGPNVAKPMHVGHLRSSILGESLKRLMRFAGDNVIGDVHLGDWGTQMGMIITELQRRQPDLPYFESAYLGPYPG